MAKLYTPEQALDRYCPMTKQNCVGTACMLWANFYREIYQASSSGFPVPPKMEATDKGYCGLGK